MHRGATKLIMSDFRLNSGYNFAYLASLPTEVVIVSSIIIQCRRPSSHRRTRGRSSNRWWVLWRESARSALSQESKMLHWKQELATHTQTYSYYRTNWKTGAVSAGRTKSALSKGRYHENGFELTSISLTDFLNACMSFLLWSMGLTSLGQSINRRSAWEGSDARTTHIRVSGSSVHFP